MISKKRMQQLQNLWINETDKKWTMKWRDDLTSEEETLVDKWDQQFIDHITRITKEYHIINNLISIIEKARKSTPNA